MMLSHDMSDNKSNIRKFMGRPHPQIDNQKGQLINKWGHCIAFRLSSSQNFWYFSRLIYGLNCQGNGFSEFSNCFCYIFMLKMIFSIIYRYNDNGYTMHNGCVAEIWIQLLICRSLIRYTIWQWCEVLTNRNASIEKMIWNQDSEKFLRVSKCLWSIQTFSRNPCILIHCIHN